MTRFFACLQFHAYVADDDKPTMQEQSVRLILAADAGEAEEKAAILGSQEEHSYVNETGETVHWKFAHVIDVQEFCEGDFTHGVEVYSRLDPFPLSSV